MRAMSDDAPKSAFELAMQRLRQKDKDTDVDARPLTDAAPAFVRSDGPLYGDGPIWRMELAVPAVWPDSATAARSPK